MQPKVEKLYRVSRSKTVADCGSDHKLCIAKFRLKLKKVGKTTRPFRYDKSNPLQLLYSGSDKQIQGVRSDRVPEELWTEIGNIAQEAVTKTIPKEKEMQEGKMVI